MPERVVRSARVRAVSLALAAAGGMGLVTGCGGGLSPRSVAATGMSSGAVMAAAADSSTKSLPGPGGQMSASVAGEVVVGYAERGQVVTLHVGQRLVVTLGAGWAAPAAHAVAGEPQPPLQPLSTVRAVGFPAGPAVAAFLAVRPGGALVSAHTDAACLHGSPPCTIAQQVFDLTVQVTPVPGTGSGPLPKPAST